MARILDRLPTINLWKWANGSDYTIDDDATLTPELAESDKETDEAYNKRYRQQPKKENSGKGKSQFRVEKKQLNTEKFSKVMMEKAEEKDIEER